MSPSKPRTEGQLRWVSAPVAAMPLMYLSWGRPFLEKTPAPIARHAGWVYVFVQRGHPRLVLLDRQVKLAAGDYVILHPDCLSDWAGEADLFGWTWRDQPTCGACRPERGGYRRWTLDRTRRREVARLHSETRREIEHPDSITPQAVAHLQGRLDVLLARATNRQPAISDAALRMELATRWLMENLAVRQPVRGLCHYLQVSPATLERLFRQHLQIAPLDYHRHLRLCRARELLEAGTHSVKQVAYAVGYRHPHDFTRAFTRWAKYPPRLFSRTPTS